MIIDTDKVATEKRKAEIEIAKAVRDIVDRFEKETGVGVDAVNIIMLDTTIFANSNRHYVVNSAKITITEYF